MFKHALEEKKLNLEGMRTFYDFFHHMEALNCGNEDDK